MVTAHDTITARTRAARERAENLLAILIEARDRSEERLADLRQADLLKAVTGRSSLDNAIAETRRMIDRLDRSIPAVRGTAPPTPSRREPEIKVLVGSRRVTV